MSNYKYNQKKEQIVQKTDIILIIPELEKMYKTELDHLRFIQSCLKSPRLYIGRSFTNRLLNLENESNKVIKYLEEEIKKRKTNLK